jgi:hypothetical protein
MYWLSSYGGVGGGVYFGEVLRQGRTREGLDIINIQIYSVEVGSKGGGGCISDVTK